MTVASRNLLRAHLGPFLFAFVLLTGAALINTVATELARLAGKGLPPMVVVEFFLLSLPATMALTVPLSALVAVLYAFSRMSADNELTALRAAGLDLRRYALPVIVAAVLASAVMAWFNDHVLPAANFRWRLLMTQVSQTQPLLALEEGAINPIPAGSGHPRYYLEAAEIDSETGWMRDVTIYQPRDDRSRTIAADSGVITYDAATGARLLTLFDGQLREVDFVDLHNFRVANFRRQVMRLGDGVGPVGPDPGEIYRTDRDLTGSMIKARIDSLRVPLQFFEARQEPARTSVAGGSLGMRSNPVLSMISPFLAQGVGPLKSMDVAARTSVSGRPNVSQPMGIDDQPPLEASRQFELPEDLTADELRRVGAERIRIIELEIRRYQAEKQKKIAMAAAVVVFVLLGIPIGVRFAGGGIGMVVSFSLAIFALHYFALVAGEALADRGYLSPVIAIWLGNVGLAAAGIPGFARLGFCGGDRSNSLAAARRTLRLHTNGERVMWPTKPLVVRVITGDPRSDVTKASVG